MRFNYPGAENVPSTFFLLLFFFQFEEITFNVVGKISVCLIRLQIMPGFELNNNDSRKRSEVQHLSPADHYAGQKAIITFDVARRNNWFLVEMLAVSAVHIFILRNRYPALLNNSSNLHFDSIGSSTVSALCGKGQFGGCICSSVERTKSVIADYSRIPRARENDAGQFAIRRASRTEITRIRPSREE